MFQAAFAAFITNQELPPAATDSCMLCRMYCSAADTGNVYTWIDAHKCGREGSASQPGLVSCACNSLSKWHAPLYCLLKQHPQPGNKLYQLDVATTHISHQALQVFNNTQRLLRRLVTPPVASPSSAVWPLPTVTVRPGSRGLSSAAGAAAGAVVAGLQIAVQCRRVPNRQPHIAICLGQGGLGGIHTNQGNTRLHGDRGHINQVCTKISLHAVCSCCAVSKSCRSVQCIAVLTQNPSHLQEQHLLVPARLPFSAQHKGHSAADEGVQLAGPPRQLHTRRRDTHTAGAQGITSQSSRHSFIQWHASFIMHNDAHGQTAPYQPITSPITALPDVLKHTRRKARGSVQLT